MMMWQDWVIMFVQWGFILSLIPTVRDPLAKPPFATCVGTVGGLAVMTFCFATLGMWASVMSLSVMTVLWGGYRVPAVRDRLRRQGKERRACRTGTSDAVVTIRFRNK